MTVERDIAGFAFPFAVGITLAAIFFKGIFCFHPEALLPTLCLWGISLGILLSDRRHHLSVNALWICITALALTSGMLSGLSGAWQSICETPKNGPISQAAYGFCESLKIIIAGTPFNDTGTPAIITALITGDKSCLSAETTHAFRESGASHILALSGLHLGIIYGIVRICLSIFGNSPKTRIFKSVLTILTCAFYSIATGAAPSIIRALIFIIAGECSQLMGRHRSTGQTLFIALIIQLTLNPLDITNIGFQLSYAAMFGIAYIFPYLDRFWPKEDSGHDRRKGAAPLTSRGLRWVWSCAAMSISCQITTAPLALYHFGTFPKYFLLTNLIALPLVGIIIPASLGVIVLHKVGCCPEFMIRATESLIVWLRESLEIVATM